MRAYPRVSFEPLALHAERYELWPKDMAKLIGIHPSTYKSWRQEGAISVWAADYVAVRLWGVHPCTIWPDWEEKMDLAVDRVLEDA